MKDKFGYELQVGDMLRWFADNTITLTGMVLANDEHGLWVLWSGLENTEFVQGYSSRSQEVISDHLIKVGTPDCSLAFLMYNYQEQLDA